MLSENLLKTKKTQSTSTISSTNSILNEQLFLKTKTIYSMYVFPVRLTEPPQLHSLKKFFACFPLLILLSRRKRSSILMKKYPQKNIEAHMTRNSTPLQRKSDSTAC